MRGVPENGRMGSMEQIEFVIFPDGRVEEKVTGVKGKNVSWIDLPCSVVACCCWELHGPHDRATWRSG
jgi:hypothetical protein